MVIRRQRRQQPDQQQPDRSSPSSVPTIASDGGAAAKQDGGSHFRKFALIVGCVASVLAIVSFVTGLFGGGEDRPPDVRIDAVQSHLNALGYDTAAAEYVCLVNASGDAVGLAGWELRDSQRLVNMLPAFELAAHGQVRVHPGRGTDSRTDIYGHAGRPAWNNGGDTITLLDDHGETVARVSYPAQDVEGTEYSSCGPGRRP
jgi:hypothetical protein